MYLKFYRFDQKPFHITPDPDFLFLSPSHKEALGSIICGIQERKGFVSISGEVGTGKTTIIRSYLDRLDKDCITPIYIFNANISFRELLQAMLAELGFGGHDEDVFASVRRIQEILIEGYRRKQNFALIIDEAQNMPIETLENLRMLSNIETSKEKLLQIILVGQPELEENLDNEEIRQLRQRLAIRATINPLTKKESLDYIHHRLSHVTKEPENVFSESSLKGIVKYAGGLPRKINIVCDNALIAGFGCQQKPITKKIVNTVISDYEGKQKRQIFKTVTLRGLAGLSLLLVFVLTPYYWNYARHEQSKFLPYEAGDIEMTSNKIENLGSIESNRSYFDPDIQLPHDGAGVVNPEMEDNSDYQVDQESVATVDFSGKVDIKNVRTEVPEITQDVNGEHVKQVSTTFSPKKSNNPTFPVFKVVKKGDYLTSLCVDVYGVTSGELVGWVWKNNPWIKNVNRLSVGDVVVFPKPNADKMNLGKVKVLF